MHRTAAPPQQRTWTKIRDWRVECVDSSKWHFSGGFCKLQKSPSSRKKVSRRGNGGGSSCPRGPPPLYLLPTYHSVHSSALSHNSTTTVPASTCSCQSVIQQNSGKAQVDRAEVKELSLKQTNLVPGKPKSSLSRPSRTQDWRVESSRVTDGDSSPWGFQSSATGEPKTETEFRSTRTRVQCSSERRVEMQGHGVWHSWFQSLKHTGNRKRKLIAREWSL